MYIGHSGGAATSFDFWNYENNYVRFATNNAERVRIDANGNVGIGAISFGTSAATVFAIANGTAPTTSPAGIIQIYSIGAVMKVRDGASNIVTFPASTGTLLNSPDAESSSGLLARLDGTGTLSGVRTVSAAWTFTSLLTVTTGANTYAIHLNDGVVSTKVFNGTSGGVTGSWIGSTTSHDLILITGGARRIFVTAAGSTVLQTAALVTTATEGFVYIPTSAGAPTGVPTTQTGTVAMEYDTTNDRLRIYNGAWKSVALA
jgi:hypothetical protein